MLRSESFFGKRDNNTGASTTSSSKPAASPAALPASMSSTSRPPAPNLAQVAAASPAAAPAPLETKPIQPESPAKLTVGPNIKLKGVEITDCDTLVVEGLVEATMDSRLIHIAKGGSFKGSAEIDIAEIYGEFDGTLTVRQKLVVHESGKVSGKISYGKLVIEEGGQLSGEIQVNPASAQKGLSMAKTA